MLELSPDDTAAKASALRIPAASRTSRSNPTPLMVRPLKSCPSLRNASTLTSMMATLWPRFSRPVASIEPTRPQPMMTMCTLDSFGDCRHRTYTPTAGGRAMTLGDKRSTVTP